MNFADFLRNVNTPVIVCRDDESKTVVYENHSAILQINPVSRSQDWKYVDAEMDIKKLLNLHEEDYLEFINILEEDGEIVKYNTTLRLYSGKTPLVSISANRVTVDGENYVLVYVYPIQSDQETQNHAQALAYAIDVAYRAETTDEAINATLDFAGNYADVSRCYIFESVSQNFSANTYEWCAEGIESMIDTLQLLPKDEYSYDQIIENGLAITDDIRKLSDEDRAILEPQGIKSLAVIPMYYRGVALGYVGFDDCARYRQWPPQEVQLLQSIADMLTSLIIRRNAERNILYSLEALNAVMNHFNNMVFVSNLETREILFANSAMASMVDARKEELIGRDFMEIMLDWAGPEAEYDPLGALLYEDGSIRRESHSWEFKDPLSGKWYLVRDSLIRWIDGQTAHIETATEITGQKEYEAELVRIASIDVMTGLYNREWCRRKMRSVMDRSAHEHTEYSLVFLDIDGLKNVNDTFGHVSGDRMIMKTTELIQSRIRRNDVLCRWGGDEFVLIMAANLEQTEHVVHNVLSLFDTYNETGREEFKLSFSYGIVNIEPESKLLIDELIKQADDKMYEHKMSRRMQ